MLVQSQVSYFKKAVFDMEGPYRPHDDLVN